MEEFETNVISLGGSIVVPQEVDTEFISRFVEKMRSYLFEDEKRRLILVVGGGKTARTYQAAYAEIAQKLGAKSESFMADYIGIMATRINAMLVKAAFGELCADPLVVDPSVNVPFTGRVLLAAGWKPGFSTDTDAVILAEKFQCNSLINLSNIRQIYTADPRLSKEALPIERISWASFLKMTGDEWKPGKNTPFDPVAAKKAQKLSLRVVCSAGADIENTLSILKGKPFIGTVIE